MYILASSVWPIGNSIVGSRGYNVENDYLTRSEGHSKLFLVAEDNYIMTRYSVNSMPFFVATEKGLGAIYIYLQEYQIVVNYIYTGLIFVKIPCGGHEINCHCMVPSSGP
jgi:hypothetical protein